MSCKWIALLTLVAAAPAAAQPPAAVQPPVRSADTALAAVPTDAFLVASVRVSKLWDNPAAKPLRDWYAAQKSAPLGAMVGLHPEDVDRVTLFKTSWDPGAGGAPLILVTTRRPYNEAAVLKSLMGDKPGDPLRRRWTGRAFEIDGPFRWVLLVDERTLLYLPRDGDDKQLSPTVLAHLISR